MPIIWTARSVSSARLSASGSVAAVWAVTRSKTVSLTRFSSSAGKPSARAVSRTANRVSIGNDVAD